MPPQEDLPPELKSFEAALAALAPRADRLQRDRLMFAAGQESVLKGRKHVASRMRRAAWPAAFAVMTAASAVLAVMAATRPGPEVVERIVYLPAAEPGESLPHDGEADSGPAEAFPEAPAPRPETPRRRSAPPRPFGISGSSLAVARPAGGWLALRRSPLDVEALDRVLATRRSAVGFPAAPGARDRQRAAATSYRDLRRDLLAGEGPNGS